MNWTQAVAESTHTWEQDIYKIGLRGFVYRFDGDEWIKSSVDRKELKPVERFSTAD